NYMAPEQAEGRTKDISPLSDVYALGTILYELLAGQTPFAGPPPYVLYNVVNREPPAPRTLNRQLPRDLETICLKCLENDPLRRYPSAEAVAADLRRFLDGKPVKARPVGAMSRGWRWCRRNPGVAGLAAAVALTLVAGLGVGCYFGVQAHI